MSKETIKIYWEGPFSIEEIQNNEIDSKKSCINGEDIGLYQIYGSHPLYGSDVLVYLGRTWNSFEKRLKNRWVIENGSDTKNVQIYLGKIFTDSGEKYDKKTEKNLIEKAEVLMINALMPAFNSSNIQSAKEFDNDYTVYNHGNFRSLYPIFDSEYFWKDFKNYNTVNGIAQEYKIKIEDKDEYYGFIIEEIQGYTFWFGIDHTIWDDKDYGHALCLEVYQDGDDKIQAIKKLKDTETYQYTDDGDSINCIPLTIDTTKDELDKKINEIKNILGL